MTRAFIGLMSGTSCDAVDAALIEVQGGGLDMEVTYVDHCSIAYPEELHHDLLGIMAPARTHTEDLARLNMEVGGIFAKCACELMHQATVRPEHVQAIGSHGQTICHLPKDNADGTGCTYQIGESAVIAAETGVTVVSDFRAADVAVGGQGAPLVPWTDYVLFASEETSRLVQNIGGIANLTHLPAGCGPEGVVAFDTGPGCVAIDELVRITSDDRRQFDPQGRYAARGNADEDCVNKMMQLPFFSQPPPKSAGREQFGRKFVRGMIKMMSKQGLKKYDRIATATLLTARSIAHAYRTQLNTQEVPLDIILCGGGARNKSLVKMIEAELPEMTVKLTDDFGIPLQAKECVSFAMLAAACIDGIPANLPQVTGATSPVVLGKIARMS